MIPRRYRARRAVSANPTPAVEPPVIDAGLVDGVTLPWDYISGPKPPPLTAPTPYRPTPRTTTTGERA